MKAKICLPPEMVGASKAGEKTEMRIPVSPQPRCRLAYVSAGTGAGKWQYPSARAYESWGDDYKIPDDLSKAEEMCLWTPPFHGDDKIDFDPKCGNIGRFAPKNEANIHMRVKEVRVERLQDITVEGIINEGINVDPPPVCMDKDPTPKERAKYERMTQAQRDEFVSTLARHRYIGWTKYVQDLFSTWEKVWDANHTPDLAWSNNPYVWVIVFERI